MSQAGIIDVEQSHPQIPTSFVGNVGTAIPIANTLEILATAVAAHGVPTQTTASGNTLTVDTQYASASASSSATNAGLASFSSAYFTVDSNGFVTLNGAGAGETITGNTGGALSPVAGNWNILGTSTAAGTTPVQTAGSGNTLTVQVQKSQAIAATNATNVGLAAFNNAQFTVDANGFVSLTGTGAGETITGNSGGALSPTAGNWNIVGVGSITTVGSGSTLDIELTGLNNHAVLVGAGTATITSVGPSATSGQVLQSQGSTTDPAYSTATYPSTTTINQILYSSAANTVSGLATADNGVLITSASGVPSLLAAGTTGQVLTATTGSPPSWESPGFSGTVTSVSVVSANGFAGTVANSTTTPAITLTTTATGVLSGNGTAISGSAVTQYDVLIAGASNAIVSVGPGTAGQVLQSGGNAANPAYSTATYPSTTSVNDILYSSSANVVGQITTADNGVLITSNAGVPSILANSGTAGYVLTANTGAPPSWQAASGGSAIETIDGDSGSMSGTTVTISGGTTGLTTTASSATMDLTGTLNVGHGGTGQTSLTAHGLLIGAGTSGITQSAVGATGTVLIGNTGADPTFSATPTVTGMTITGTPSAGTDATNVTYVQNALATVNPSTSAYAASTVNIPGTYTPVGSGIGDTFLTTATGAFTLDGTTPPVGSIILLKNQSTTFQNGLYTLTTNGTGITGTLFTRALDYDQPSDINSTGVIAVINGTVNQLTGWLLNVTVTAVGSSPITYVQYNTAPISVTQYSTLVGGATNTIIGNISPGSSGQVWTSNGASSNPSFQAVVSTPTYPSTFANSVVDFVDDFFYGNTTTLTSGLMGTWGIVSTGTGAGVSAQGNGSKTNIGVVDIMTGTATSGACCIGQIGTSASGNIIPGGGVITQQWVLALSALSSSSQRFSVNVGFTDNTAGVPTSYGAWFSQIDNVNSGNMVINCLNGGTLTSVNTNKQIPTGSFCKLEIMFDATAANVHYYFNGSELAASPITSNIPTADLGQSIEITKSVGTTNRFISLDLNTLNIVLTTPR